MPFTSTDKGSFSNERENDCPEDIKFTASIGIQTGLTLFQCPLCMSSIEKEMSTAKEISLGDKI
ncbi:hypothetical protein VEA_002148 [Vibrio antiquarius]|uniref:Uncharacterized protein n=1 Tax=Vibrio antiquarius (strain Ex25) TaxID=150340 RepID=A0ACA6QJ61_VIBAE|nr:hypothetical protein VEA_002148 [Vibrio antiquarius]